MKNGPESELSCMMIHIRRDNASAQEKRRGALGAWYHPPAACDEKYLLPAIRNFART